MKFPSHVDEMHQISMKFLRDPWDAAFKKAQEKVMPPTGLRDLVAQEPPTFVDHMEISGIHGISWLVGGLQHFLFFPYIGNHHPNWLICLYIFQRGWNHQPDGDLTDLTDSRQILDSHGAIINNQGDWDRELIWINHQYGCDYGNKMARENQ